MPRIKYALHDGYVVSQYDHDEHFINCERLLELYKLRREDCIFMRSGNPETQFIRLESNVVHLHPRYSGNYDVPD